MASKAEKRSLGNRFMMWLLRKIGRFGAWFVMRVAFPMAWVIGTLYLAVNHYTTIGAYFESNPIATVTALTIWTVIGGAWLPFSRRFYTTTSGLLVVASAVFSAVVLNVDFTHTNVWIFGGGGVLGFFIAWIAGAGTALWKFAHLKLPTDDDDT